MNKILNHFLNIDDSNKIKAVDFFDKIFFSIVSAFVIFVVGGYFFISSINIYSDNQYKILIGAFGLTATLSGLLFRGKSSTEDSFKQRVFYRMGENFLHATVLFIFSITFKFCIDQLKVIQSSFLIDLITIPFQILAFISFFCGLLLSVGSLCVLNFILTHYKISNK